MRRDISMQLERPARALRIFKLPRSLRNRLVLWNLLAFLFTFLILGIIVFVLVTSYLEGSLDTRLSVQSEKMQIATTIWIASGHQLNDQLFSHLVQAEPANGFAADDPLYITLIDAHTSRTFYRFPSVGITYLASTQPDFKSALGGQNVFQTYQRGGKQRVRTLTFPLRNKDGAIVAVAQVGRSMASIDETEKAFLMILGGGILGAALFAYVLASAASNRELRPLSDLSSTLCDLSADGLGACLIPTSSAIEIRQLTDAFNQMTKRLETSFQFQRDFVADVSHELRTPLTAIRGQLDVLLMDQSLASDAYRDLQHIHAEVGHVSRLLTNLLLMARAEAGIVLELSGKHCPPVEVDTIVVEIVRSLQRSNLDVTLEMGQLEQLHVQGDRDLLKQMIFNIVENALSYTPAGGNVFVEVVAVHNLPRSATIASRNTCTAWAAIKVRDTGLGIAPGDLPHVFEQYSRVGQSNPRSKRAAGLGLFIARLIAKAHSGDISVESELMKGSCFSIWLPYCC